MSTLPTNKEPVAGNVAQGRVFTLAVGETLPTGATFDRWILTNGQEEPSNFIDIVEGYHPDNYFRSGKYLGADEAGVEPQFACS